MWDWCVRCPCVDGDCVIHVCLWGVLCVVCVCLRIVVRSGTSAVFCCGGVAACSVFMCVVCVINYCNVVLCGDCVLQSVLFVVRLF